MPIRDEDLVALWDDGLTMTEIGQRVGLSRERVRQRLKPSGRSGSNPNRVPAEAAIRRAIDDEFGLANVARRLGVSIARLVRGIERYGIADDVEAAFAAKRDYWRDSTLERTRRKIIDRIRIIASQVKHTPTQGELMVHDVYHAELARQFGSAAEAMLAAGLRPNVRGQRPCDLPPDYRVPIGDGHRGATADGEPAA